MNYICRFLIILVFVMVGQHSMAQVRVFVSIGFSERASKASGINEPEAKDLICIELAKNPGVFIVKSGVRDNITTYIYVTLDIARKDHYVMSGVVLRRPDPRTLLQDCSDISPQCVAAMKTRLEKDRVGIFGGTVLLMAARTDLREQFKALGHTLSFYFEPRL